MPALSYVYPYPAQGFADRPSVDDAVADVAIRGCRTVAELYSEALRPLALPNGVSELRLFFRHDPQLADVHATVHVDPVREGFEFGHVDVPTGFAARTPRVRAGMLLQAVHGLVNRLAAARGWDATALEVLPAARPRRRPGVPLDVGAEGIAGPPTPGARDFQAGAGRMRTGGPARRTSRRRQCRGVLP